MPVDSLPSLPTTENLFLCPPIPLSYGPTMLAQKLAESTGIDIEFVTVATHTSPWLTVVYYTRQFTDDERLAIQGTLDSLSVEV